MPTLLFTFRRFHHFCLTQLRQYQPSNVARELKQKLGVGGQGGGGVGGQVGAGDVGGGQGGPRDDFVLGQEPQGGVPSKEAAVKQSTASRLFVQFLFSMFHFADDQGMHTNILPPGFHSYNV